MHVDSDGETILETPEEIRAFRQVTDCNTCRAEADEILAITNNLPIKKISFTTKCTHQILKCGHHCGTEYGITYHCSCSECHNKIGVTENDKSS